MFSSRSWCEASLGGGKGRVCGQGEPQRPWRHPFSATPPPSTPIFYAIWQPPSFFYLPFFATVTPPLSSCGHFQPAIKKSIWRFSKKGPSSVNCGYKAQFFWHTIKAINNLIYSNIQMTLISLAQIGRHVECRKVARWGFMFSLCP